MVFYQKYKGYFPSPLRKMYMPYYNLNTKLTIFIWGFTPPYPPHTHFFD